MRTIVNRQVVQTAGFFVAFALCLFVPAGTIAWLAGWVFLVMFFAFYLGVTLWLFKHNPGLVQERTRLGTSDQKGWDKVLFPLMNALLILWLVFMSLDSGRFHWSSVPIWLQAVGAAVLLCSFYLLFLTFRVNSYLSPVVRIQGDRKQTVVITGPYRYVRHPMYPAIMIFVFGTALLLGPFYGLLFGLIPLSILVRRTILEERELLKGLPGYGHYMAKVKYRFIPHIW